MKSLSRFLPRRFSIKLLMVVVAIACAVLAQFYPHTYSSVLIQCGAVNHNEALTYCRIARSNKVLAAVVAKTPAVSELASGEPVDWLSENVDATPTDDNLIQLKIIGSPRNRRQLQLIMDALAAEFVTLLQQSAQSVADETLSLLSEAKDQLDKDHSVNPTPRTEALVVALEQRLADAERHAQNPPAEPKIIQRRTGREL